LHEIHKNDVEARKKLLPGIAGNSNPDMRVGETYFDVKSPKVKSKAAARIIEAQGQQSIAVITDLKTPFDDNDISYWSQRAFNDKEFSGESVWWYTNGSLREIKKR
jgi:hypothetical protein